MFVLLLNDMRSGRIEDLTPVARAETKEELLALLEREKVEEYTDEGDHVNSEDHSFGISRSVSTGYRYGKTYRKGGPLEWYNPPWEVRTDQHFRNVGTREDWMKNAGMEFDENVGTVPTVDDLEVKP
jgi:hypothetical protein